MATVHSWYCSDHSCILNIHSYVCGPFSLGFLGHFLPTTQCWQDGCHPPAQGVVLLAGSCPTQPPCLCLTAKLQDAQGNMVSLRPPLPSWHQQPHLAALETTTKLTDSPFSVPWMLNELARTPCLGIQTLLSNFFSGTSESKCMNFLQAKLGLAAS